MFAHLAGGVCPSQWSNSGTWISPWFSSWSVDLIWSFGAGFGGTTPRAPSVLSLTALPFLFPYLHSTDAPTDFSSCSRVSFAKFFENKLSDCLLNAPLPANIISTPLCGNQLVEEEEDCDCGTSKVQPSLSYKKSSLSFNCKEEKL